MRILIPVKSFVAAKQRLANFLTTEQRNNLAQAMLQDMLRVLRQSSEVDEIFIVTSAKQVIEVAEQYQAKVIAEPNPGSLNTAVQHAFDILRQQNQTPIIVLPGDLPCLSCREVNSWVRQRQQAPLTISPAHDEDGTNALMFWQPQEFEFCYGSGSFNKHKAVATLRNLSHHIYPNARLGLDIDRPDDFLELLNNPLLPEYSHTTQQIQRWNLPTAPPIATKPLVQGDIA